MKPGLMVVFFSGISVLWMAIAVGSESVGPDPAEWVLHRCGLLALILLVCTLSVSSLARRMRVAPVVAWRRPLGLASFFFAALHVLVYATAYQGLDARRIAEDVMERSYILIGFVAFVLLLPLAATSTRRARVRLGSAWKKLHRAVYVIVPLAVLHQGLAQKADVMLTTILFALTVVLLLERLLHARR